MNVNVFAGEWMSKWSADGMDMIVLQELCATVFSCYKAYMYIYTTIAVCGGEIRERRWE